MQKFPRVFEVLLSKEKSKSIIASDFDENNNIQDGIEYLDQVKQWLRSLPHFNETCKPAKSSQLSIEAIEEVKRAVHQAVCIHSIL